MSIFGQNTNVSGVISSSSNFTTLKSVDTNFNDDLIEIGSGTSADSGLILNQITNKAILWDNSENEFSFITTNDNALNTVITPSAYSNLHVNGLKVSSVELNNTEPNENNIELSSSVASVSIKNGRTKSLEIKEGDNPYVSINTDAKHVEFHKPLIIGDDSLIQGRAGNDNVGLIIGQMVGGFPLNNVLSVMSQENNDATAQFIHGGSKRNKQYGIAVTLKSDPNNETNYLFRGRGARKNRAQIMSNGSFYGNGTYGTLSDLNLKTDIIDANPQLDKLMNIRIRNFKFKDKLEEEHIGVIAQELETYYPKLVEEHRDEELETTTKQVKQSVFIWIVIKAIQELREIVRKQEEEIKELRKNI